MARTTRSETGGARKSRAKPPTVEPGGEREDPGAVRHMIEEAAYYRAQSRGFQGGDPLDDWLVAEAEINSRLHRHH